MSIDLNAVIGQIGRDKGIDKGLLVEAIEAAVLSAARKHFGHNLNLEARINEDDYEIEVMMYRVVVDKVLDNATQMSLEEARLLDPGAMIGDELGQQLETEALGRIAAQTAKQVIIQKLRDAERGVIFEEYKDSKGELISGIVQRYEQRGSWIVNLGRTEAILPRREQIHRERYRQGDRVRAMILDIDQSARGPQIILTRSHPAFLKSLFELEVPEISDGIVEIKAVAREPGERAKVAVISRDDSVDPVGACVGVRGSRVLSVVQELRGERIDIITWTPDEPSFVARALSPAEVSRVVMDEENRSMEVIVNDDQLSLAIGRKGQNVKLASRLTGWKLDVRSVSAAEEDNRKARASVEAISGLSFTEAEFLLQEGFRTASEIADATREELVDVDGISEDRVDHILEEARKTAELQAQEQEDTDEETLTDLHQLVLDPMVRDRLVEGGYSSLQALIDASDEDLLAIDAVEEEHVTAVREEVEKFLKSGKNV